MHDDGLSGLSNRIRFLRARIKDTAVRLSVRIFSPHPNGLKRYIFPTRKKEGEVTFSYLAVRSHFLKNLQLLGSPFSLSPSRDVTRSIKRESPNLSN